MKIYQRYNLLIRLVLLFIIMAIMMIFIKFYFKPFWTLIIMFVFSTPICNMLTRSGINRKISGVISIAFLNIMIFLLLTILSRSFYSFVSNFSNQFNGIYNHFIMEYRYIFDYIKEIQFVDALSIIGKSNITSKLKSTGSQFIAYFIGNVVCYFVFTEKEEIKYIMSKILSYNIVNKLKFQKDNLLKMVLIEGKLVMISTIEIIIGFCFLGVNNYIFLGIICGILDVLPYIGTIIVFIPLIIYNFISGKYFLAIGLILLYIFVEVIREILEAKFLGENLKIHPIVIFLSIYVSIEIFGLIGVIFGPIYCIIAKDMILEG